MASRSLLMFWTTTNQSLEKNWNLLPFWIENVLMPGIIRVWNGKLGTEIWNLHDIKGSNMLWDSVQKVYSAQNQQNNIFDDLLWGYKCCTLRLDNFCKKNVPYFLLQIHFLAQDQVQLGWIHGYSCKLVFQTDIYIYANRIGFNLYEWEYICNLVQRGSRYMLTDLWLHEVWNNVSTRNVKYKTGFPNQYFMCL